MSRVFISGYGTVSSLGNNVEDNFNSLLINKSNHEIIQAWQEFKGLNTHIGALVKDLDVKFLPRNIRRTMSKMSEMATLATYEALKMANLNQDDLKNINAVINIGSSSGGVTSMHEFYQTLHRNNSTEGLLATSLFKNMSHSAAMNVGMALGFYGPVFSTNAACSSGSQTLALMFDLVKLGVYDLAIVGGCDEADLVSALSFDLAKAASTHFNHEPHKASRPFDERRDGLVTSEGAGILIIESENHLHKRSGIAICEVLSAVSFSDPSHVSQPSVESMAKTMNLALEKSQLNHSKIDYVNAHATSTILGDEEEAKAISNVFNRRVKVSSLKGHMGHSFAASGALEIAMICEMFKADKIIGTKNLDSIAPSMPDLEYLTDNVDFKMNYALSNNFALGGINTAVILKKII